MRGSGGEARHLLPPGLRLFRAVRAVRAVQKAFNLGGPKSAWRKGFEWVKIPLDCSPVKRVFHFRAASSQLGPLEERILEALWQHRSATVREVLQAGHADLAYTTVMTTLDRLYKKGLLTREPEGRAFRYAPCLTREEMHREVAGEAVRQMLDASPRPSLPLSYLVDVLSERDAQLLDELGELVENKRRQLRSIDLPAPDGKRKDTQ